MVLYGLHCLNNNHNYLNERKCGQAHIPYAPLLIDNATYDEWQESICIECTKYFDFKMGKTPKKSSHRNLLQVCSSTFLSLPTTKF